MMNVKVMKMRSDILMLITAILWGAAFVAQKNGVEHIGPFLFSGIRFAIGAIAVFPLLLFYKGENNNGNTNKGILGAGVLMGIVLAIALNLQQVGLLYTSVTNSGFITGLYVILVPIIGLFLGHKISLPIWVGAVLAVIGMYLLSVGNNFKISKGDWFQFLGAFAWAAQVLIVGAFSGKFNSIRLAFIQFITCAVISLVLAGVFEKIDFNSIYQALPALLYAGIVASGIAFTLQIFAQKGSIPSHAALILSMEAVFSAIAAYLILGEVLTCRAYLGCFLMLIGVLAAQLLPTKFNNKVESIQSDRL